MRPTPLVNRAETGEALLLTFDWQEDGLEPVWERFESDPAAVAVFAVCEECSGVSQSVLEGDLSDVEAVPVWLLGRVIVTNVEGRA